jgi:aminoglycoside 6'-N-acetyltransferase
MNPDQSRAHLAFRRVEEADLSLLGRWLLMTHVALWYPDADYSEDLEDQLDDPRIAMFLVILDGRPFAYVQDYDVHGWKDHPLSFLPVGSRGLDTFIGDAACVGKGLGATYLRLRGDALLAGGAPALGIDPAEDNLAAQRAFAKAGFLRHGVSEEPWGRVVLMTRSGGSAPHFQSA